MSDSRKLTYYSVEEPAVEVSDDNHLPEVTEPEPANVSIARKSGRWGKWLAVGVVFALSAALIEAVLMVLERLQQNVVLGSLWAVGFGVIVFAFLSFIVREIWLLQRLKRRWKKQSAEPEQQLQLLEHPDLEHRWQQIKQSYWSADEKRERFEVDILSRVDQQATRVISRWSAEAAAMVAVSPFALLDMLIVMWRNQRMISRIAELYGVKLGYWARVRLWRQVFANIAYAGLSEVAADLGAQWVSAELLTRLSTRAGQGLGAGLLTARLGYQVIELCRPMPFEKVKKPGYLKLQKDLLSQLKSVLPFVYKSRQTKAKAGAEQKVEN
ncbi:YcjF family protein [Idiomarina ramblicola]|uniref:TIGR01620 family protein n=1 Tax=Idiomarina ramblicola TaxID=263724 RepID=A0A432Z4R7_9GAMM|nr:TIGR01620 family protein [Idiomarina ramblicola]RUO72877.1 TIGR01620 family protein [Idiomarina ramblicola]